MLTLEKAPEIQVDLVHPMHAMPAPVMLPEAEAASAVRDRRALRREFVNALSGNDFSLRFQPRYRIATPRLTATEVVIRWQHRRRGVIPEVLLMSLAEKAGIAGEVHRWAVMEAAASLARLPRSMCLAFSIAPFQLRGSMLADNLHMAIEQFGILPEQIELSITEMTLSALDDAALMVLASLFDDGMAVALSHFGASLGSLNLLARIPLDCVKLDASLVRGVPHDPSSIAMVRAVTEVAHSLGARVVAQGVETMDQREVLAKLRCDELQGGIAGPAMTARELGRLTF